jgi:hypothetical protein
MRIISKFDDYYDTAFAYGHDDTYTYIRKTEEVSVDLPENHYRTWIGSQYLNEYAIILGFCGKFYFGHVIEHGLNQTVCWSVSDIEKFINSISDIHLKKELAASFDGKKTHSFRFYYNRKRQFKSTREAFEYYFSQTIPDSTDKFFEYGTPVFSLEYRTTRFLSDFRKPSGVLCTNPRLKDLDFYKVMEPYVAFQEIDMFLGGVLGSAHPPMKTISDIAMRDKKGFDEWSFKKKPTKIR